MSGGPTSTPLECAARAVSEAWETAFWDCNRDSLTHLVTAVRAHDIELVRAEALTDDTGTAADNAYQQAINDAAQAIGGQS